MRSARRITLFALFALSILAQSVLGQTDPQEIVLEDAVVMTAEVIGIDRMDRTVTLLGPEGNVVVVEVGPEARNFDQIEIGDQLEVKYYQSVAVYIDMHGNKPKSETAVVTARSPKGDKPAGIAVETVDISAQVHSIDRSTHSVTLKLHDGRIITTKVDKSVKIYDRLKKGDKVHVRYTEAFAISVG
jgi:translation initiation factor IF-1